jgi:hypothetical protein
MSEQEARKNAATAAEARARGIQEYELEMAQAVPTDVIRDIVKDSRAPSGPSSISATRSTEPVEQSSGWYEPAPLRPYSGDRYVQQMCENAAAQEQATVAQGPLLMQAMASLVGTLRLLLERQGQKPTSE